MDSDTTITTTTTTFDAERILARLKSERGRARDRVIDLDQVRDAIAQHEVGLAIAKRLAAEVDGFEEQPVTKLIAGVASAYFKRATPRSDVLVLSGTGIVHAERGIAERGFGWRCVTRLRVPQGVAGELVKAWLASGEIKGTLHGGYLSF